MSTPGSCPTNPLITSTSNQLPTSKSYNAFVKNVETIRTLRILFNEYGVRHFILLISPIAYITMVASTFVLLERSSADADRDTRKLSSFEMDEEYANEIARNKTNHVDRLRNTLLRYHKGIDDIIDLHMAYIQEDLHQETMAFSEGLQKAFRRKECVQRRIKWDFSKATIYALSIFTTNGHNYLRPETESGRIATALYAFLGVPLLLLCLTDYGQLLATIVRRLRRTARFLGRRLIMYCSHQGHMEIQTADTRDLVNYRHYDIHWFLGIIAMLSWILFFPVIMMFYIDHHNYGRALYAFFLSFCTITFDPDIENDLGAVVLTTVGLIVGLTFVFMTLRITKSRRKIHVLFGNNDPSVVAPLSSRGVGEVPTRRPEYQDPRTEDSMLLLGRSSMEASMSSNQYGAKPLETAGTAETLRLCHVNATCVAQSIQTHISFVTAKQILVDINGNASAITEFDGKSRDDVRKLFRAYSDDDFLTRPIGNGQGVHMGPVIMGPDNGEEPTPGEPVVLSGSLRSEEALLRNMDHHFGGSQLSLGAMRYHQPDP